jgi:hypothetical protein
MEGPRFTPEDASKQEGKKQIHENAEGLFSHLFRSEVRSELVEQKQRNIQESANPKRSIEALFGVKIVEAKEVEKPTELQFEKRHEIKDETSAPYVTEPTSISEITRSDSYRIQRSFPDFSGQRSIKGRLQRQIRRVMHAVSRLSYRQAIVGGIMIGIALLLICALLVIG